MSAPRLLLCAPASGGGKTTVTCALLQALVNRGAGPVAFKCGPDYIDPMFHSEIILSLIHISLEALSAPDRVFLGGTSGSLEDILNVIFLSLIHISSPRK